MPPGPWLKLVGPPGAAGAVDRHGLPCGGGAPSGTPGLGVLQLANITGRVDVFTDQPAAVCQRAVVNGTPAAGVRVTSTCHHL